MQLVGIQIYNLDIARIKKQYKDMFTYLRNDIYEILGVNSVALNLLSLLASSSSSNVDEISFMGVVILSVYLTLNFLISYLSVGTFKSACKTLLDI